MKNDIGGYKNIKICDPLKYGKSESHLHTDETDSIIELKFDIATGVPIPDHLGPEGIPRNAFKHRNLYIGIYNPQKGEYIGNICK